MVAIYKSGMNAALQDIAVISKILLMREPSPLSAVILFLKIFTLQRKIGHQICNSEMVSKSLNQDALISKGHLL